METRKDKLNKVSHLMETMSVSEKKDQFSNIELVFPAYDGNIYGVIKENSKYIIKKATNRNANSVEDFDYIDGVQNKSKYSKTTITEAQKTLNLWNIEFGRVYGTLNEAKHVLKVPAPEKKNSEPLPGLDSTDDLGLSDDSTDSLEGLPVSGDEDLNDDGELPGLEDSEASSENPDDYADVDPDDLDTEDPKKMIQKLAGKLAYELREYDDEDYSDTAKFAMSMAISALKSDKMSDEDKNSIENKFDTKFDAESDENLGLEVEPESDSSEVEDSQGIEISDEDSETSKDVEVEEDFVNEVIGNEPEDYIRDFQKSKAPQFQGKSKEKKRQMALAAYYQNESMTLRKKDLVKLLSENEDPLRRWAFKVASDFNSGRITNTPHLLSIIENNIESHGIDVNLNQLRRKFESLIHGSKISGQIILTLVDSALNQEFTDIDEDFYFEENEPENILFDDENEFNPYEVDDEDLLFDMDEEVYSQRNKTPKVGKFSQYYPGVGNIGRYDGDDSAVDETEDFYFE
jgi:hypothetical protein